MKALPLVILAMFLNAGAQLLLKAGMNRIGFFTFSWQNFLPVSLQIMANPYILGGIFIYIFSLCTWLLVLSRIDVAIAYPLTSLAYVLTAIASYYIFGEHLSSMRIIGIFVILLGVYLIART